MNKDKKQRIFRISLFTSSIVFFAFLFILAISIGRYNIIFKDIFKIIFTNNKEYEIQKNIIIFSRLPRTIIATLTGIALSISGLVYQEIFQNKLTSPNLLGVSNGAAVGAAFAILLGLSSFFITVFSFTMGIATVFITLAISKIFTNNKTTILILAGVIVSSFMASILSVIKFSVNSDSTLATITYWLMGSFSNSKLSDLIILTPIVTILSISIILIRWHINIIALGEDEAKTKGINYKAFRLTLIIISTILTASTVAFSGAIAWVGLLIPHITRIIIGKNTKYSIPFCIVFGAIFMVLTDIISRSFTQSEIPISAITGIFSAIIFLIIVIFKRRKINDN